MKIFEYQSNTNSLCVSGVGVGGGGDVTISSADGAIIWAVGRIPKIMISFLSLRNFQPSISDET